MLTLHEQLDKILKDYDLSPEKRSKAANQIILMLDEEGFYTEQEYFGCGC